MRSQRFAVSVRIGVETWLYNIITKSKLMNSRAKLYYHFHHLRRSMFLFSDLSSFLLNISRGLWSLHRRIKPTLRAEFSLQSDLAYSRSQRREALRGRLETPLDSTIYLIDPNGMLNFRPRSTVQKMPVDTATIHISKYAYLIPALSQVAITFWLFILIVESFHIIYSTLPHRSVPMQRRFLIGYMHDWFS